MKKTLLALAAIAASSAAFAQSSVTLYGVVDASLESAKSSSATVTRVSSDNLSSSRFGLKGTEAIEGGLKANFALESGLKVDTGANGGGTTRFFDRAAWIGLAGGFGDVRLGRIDSLIGDIAGNVLSAQTPDDLKLLNTRAGDSYRRVDNAITYNLPTLVPGLALAAQYSTAANGTETVNSTTGDNVGKSYGLSAKYAAGPLSAGIGYLNVKDAAAFATPNFAGNQKANATLAYVGYDLGTAKVTAYYDTETNTPNNAGLAAGSVNTRRLSILGAKVAVPFTPEFTLVTGLSTARNTKGTQAGDDNVQVVTVKGLYSLSKRTTAYAMFSNVNNGQGTNYNFTGTTEVNNKTSRMLAVGLRHAF
jgi:GBP family porin